MKVRCDISGIDCPHCASKLEGLLKKNFIDANLNFATGSLVIDVEDNINEDDVVQKANKIASDFEDGIEILIRDQFKKDFMFYLIRKMILKIMYTNSQLKNICY